MNAERLLQIILGFHASEKTETLKKKNKSYVFKVMVSATKPEIKQAVENLFSTKVSSVRVVNVKPEVRRFRGVEGVKKKWKKAYITLENGLSIASSEGNVSSD